MNAKNIFILASCTLALLACSSAPTPEDPESKDEGTMVASVGSSLGVGRKTVKIPVSVGSPTIAAEEYSVELTGCASGRSMTVTQADHGGVELYSGDRSCVAKLSAFSVGGVPFDVISSGAADFTTWRPNDTATFASAEGELIHVTVVAQLGATIRSNEVIAYAFSKLRDEASSFALSDAVGNPQLLPVANQEAPHFEVVAGRFVGMDDETGAGEYFFKLQCVGDPLAVDPAPVAMTAGAAAGTVCGATDLANVTYKLVRNTFDSNLTITEAESLFSTPGLSVAIPGAQYRTDGVHRGFETSMLTGPGPMGKAGNERMILIVKAGISFTYYNVDLTPLVQ